MPRLAFKPDSSFFRKIALGAVGSRAVCADLSGRGHRMVELERGSTDTKLWKDVKRKRVRIPDLLCSNCGLRVESRAKTDADLSMSHSPTEESRAWDFGMVDRDVVAFPICRPSTEASWSRGQLRASLSYWHERNWVRWQPQGCINYFTVAAFRGTPPVRTSTKGVTEGSETSVAWNAAFSSRAGVIQVVTADRVSVRRDSDGHSYTWRIGPGQRPVVVPGQRVQPNQILASAVPIIADTDLACPGHLPSDCISSALRSRERTLRFTGAKLARIRRELEFRAGIEGLASDHDEDVYIRLEAASYLASVCGLSARELFDVHLNSADPQTQLEAVIALGEAATDGAVSLLAGVLDDADRPYFLRSAAAWSLSRAGSRDGLCRLIKAFGDVDRSIREEALDGIVGIGGPSVPMLLTGLRGADPEIAAGCAESLRQQGVPQNVLDEILSDLRAGVGSEWTTWLVGLLPRERVATAIADLQTAAPHLHYAVSLLWSFVESWIARRWECFPASPEEVSSHA